MQFIKCWIFFAVVIAAAGICCKKNKQPQQPSEEKKVTVSTIAGDGSRGFGNGPALAAKFSSPTDVAVTADGTIYVSDYINKRIRKIAGGEVFTFAGNDTFGFKDGNGGMAQFADPWRIAVDQAGNCYSIDEVDTRIRKITPGADVSTYAGTFDHGYLDGPALTAQFWTNMSGIACDGSGNIYVGDTFNHRIRKISVAGQVSTIAGDGTRVFRNGDAATAQFLFPWGVACDRQGNVYVADRGNFCIRKISPAGQVTTFAGTGTAGKVDGDRTVAQFYSLFDLVVDSQENLYVIDENRIRKVTPQCVVSTIAGSTPGYADGDGADAKFGSPEGLGIDAQGNIYVADGGNQRVRKIRFE